MPNPRLHLTHEIRRAVGVVGSEPTIMGGNALAKTGVHALDGPEHTPPTLGGDLQGAGATLEVRALQGVAITGTPTAGDLLAATAADAAAWAGLTDDQLASGTPVAGDAPLSNGDGTRTWGAASGGGGMFGDIEGGSPTSIYGGTDPIDGGGV